MKKLYVLLFSILLLQCKTIKIKGDPIIATITKEGFIDCFENGLSFNSKPVWCEASAILFDGNKLFFANDKEMPDQRSSIFYWMFKDGFWDTALQPAYLINPLLKKGIKFEDFATTPDGKYALLSTAFDRAKAGSNEWDGYNSIFFWKAGDENNPQVISINGTDSTSISYRDKISKNLTSDSFKNGMPYFKLEGLAATEDKIYWGVREEGKKFDDFKYKVKIICVSYKIENGRIKLEDDFTLFSDINIYGLFPTLPEGLGVSSIEYDKIKKKFLILTTYESGGTFGSYLLIASLEELKSNKMNLVMTSSGSPLFFKHKAEDMAIINSHRIIVIHDDDKIVTEVGSQKRKENQAAYSIVEFMHP